MSELRECPMCGGMMILESWQDITESDTSIVWATNCPACDYGGGAYDSAEEAIAACNARAYDAELVAKDKRIAELEAAIARAEEVIEALRKRRPSRRVYGEEANDES